MPTRSILEDLISNLFTLGGDRMSTKESTYRIIQLPTGTIFFFTDFLELQITKVSIGTLKLGRDFV